MQSISWLALSWCVLPLLVVAVIYWHWFGTARELVLASLRMLIQLIGVGYLLVLIFAQPSLWVSLLVTLVMFVAASWIAIRPVEHLVKQHPYIWQAAAIALVVPVLLHLVLSLKLVLQVDNGFEARVLIPLAGMYFANTMTTISLSAERFFAELEPTKLKPTKPKPAQLGNDKTVNAAKKNAFQAAMIPQINGLLAVGLVALPGMMTGQILSGVSPLIAVRYQIMIMTMMIGTCGMGSTLLLWQLQRQYLKTAA